MNTKEEILETSRIVAMVGLSLNFERPSHIAASYLRENGYRIVPVNPNDISVFKRDQLCISIQIERRRREGNYVFESPVEYILHG